MYVQVHIYTYTHTFETEHELQNFIYVDVLNYFFSNNNSLYYFICQPESKNVSKWRKFPCEIKREREGKKDRKRACCLSECVQGRNMCPQFYCTAQNCV